MPSNVFLRKGITEAKRDRINRTLTKAQRFAERLVEGRAVWFDLPVYSNLMARISRSAGNWDFFRRLTPPRFDGSRCVRCGLCVRLCPVGTLRLSDEGVAGGEDCVFCVRCFSFCPRGAISFDHYRSARYRAVSATDLLAEKPGRG